MQQYCEKLFEQFGSNSRVAELFAVDPNGEGANAEALVTDAGITGIEFRSSTGFKFDGSVDGGQQQTQPIGSKDGLKVEELIAGFQTNKDGKVFPVGYKVGITQMGNPATQNQETMISVFTADNETKVTVKTYGSNGEYQICHVLECFGICGVLVCLLETLI